MARQRIVPIAVAIALTAAAGLSITEEHMRWHAAATKDGPLLPVTSHAASDAAAGHAVPETSDNAAVKKASDMSTTRSLPSVGSRALIGD